MAGRRITLSLSGGTNSKARGVRDKSQSRTSLNESARSSDNARSFSETEIGVV